MMGPGPRLMKKNLLGRGLTKFEKHWPTKHWRDNIKVDIAT